MGSIRIPVSLKFDVESDFYQNFILDMKENKTLASFIVDILQSYHENETVKVTVHKNMDSNNPYTEIYNQLDRIQLEHSKTLTNVSMLATHNQTAMEDMENNIAGFQDTATSSPEPPTPQIGMNNALLQRLEALEQTVNQVLPSIDSRLAQILDKPQSTTVASTTVSNPNTTVSQPSSQEAPSSSPEPTQGYLTPNDLAVIEPEVIESQIEEAENPPVKEVTPSISWASELVEEKTKEYATVGSYSAPTSVEAPSFESVVSAGVVPSFDAPTPPTTGAPSIVFMSDDEEDEPQVVEEQPKKPASFGKAFKSLKK